ncbi:MAG: hypothetical protein MJZ16_07020, partial [Bacteroidales bacterium]|nr:hypothetical protein [Bacteroidales bacterium]
MDLTDLQKPIKVSLDVTGRESWHNSFTVEYDGATRRVPMLAFQHEQDTPKTIDCIASPSASGIKLRQNLANLAQQFYQIGETYSFKIKNDFRSSGGYYELIDSEGRGFTPYLQDIFMSDLRKGQEIICKVVGFCSQGPKVRFAQSGALSAFSFDKDAISSLLSEVDWDKEGFAQLILSSAMESDFETSSHRWIVSQTESKQSDDALSLVDDIRNSCRVLIEDTPLLDKCGNMEEREVIQKRLTDIIEQAGYYLHALQLLGQDEAEKFISDILRKLSTSGFLYHPRKNFCILTFLFMIRPELLEKNLPQLLDVILSKKEEIWKVEPFRSEIAKQLDLYISNTDEKIPSMENSEEAVSNIFKALAIQICLCNDAEQMSLQTARYKAMLLRYTSMKDVPNPHTLLNISYSYLIGQLSKVTGLSFADISNDIKVSSKLYYGAVQATDFEDITPLMYEGNGARLDISDEGIVISPARETEELKNILPPEGISVWNDMTVMVGKDYSKPAIKKGSNVDVINKTLWKSVEKYLFESAPKATEKKVQAKKFAPTVGDEVYVYVTRIDDATKTLYCTIEDDKYEGDGYIRISDIVNYNLPVISDSMFRHEDTGAPYLFKATVAEIGSGLSYRFTMKSLIWNRPDFIKNNVGEGTPCILYLYDGNLGKWHAITENGFSIMLSEKEGFVDEVGDEIILNQGDLVYAEGLSFKQMMIQGKVDELITDTPPL